MKAQKEIQEQFQSEINKEKMEGEMEKLKQREMDDEIRQMRKMEKLQLKQQELMSEVLSTKQQSTLKEKEMGIQSGENITQYYSLNTAKKHHCGTLTDGMGYQQKPKPI